MFDGRVDLEASNVLVNLGGELFAAAAPVTSLDGKLQLLVSLTVFLPKRRELGAKRAAVFVEPFLAAEDAAPHFLRNHSFLERFRRAGQ